MFDCIDIYMPSPVSQSLALPLLCLPCFTFEDYYYYYYTGAQNFLPAEHRARDPWALQL